MKKQTKQSNKTTSQNRKAKGTSSRDLNVSADQLGKVKGGARSIEFVNASKPQSSN